MINKIAEIDLNSIDNVIDTLQILKNDYGNALTLQFNFGLLEVYHDTNKFFMGERVKILTGYEKDIIGVITQINKDEVMLLTTKGIYNYYGFNEVEKIGGEK